MRIPDDLPEERQPPEPLAKRRLVRCPHRPGEPGSTPGRVLANETPVRASQHPFASTWLAILMALSLSLPTFAQAERADRDKPVNLEADRVDLDDARKEALFVGNVTLTQGTMSIKADQITVKQDAEGFQYGIALGKPAHFRQKREGLDEYVEGFSERLEYDGRAEKIQLFTNARIQRGADEIRGDYISYNALTELFQVIGSGPGGKTSGNSTGRVRVILQPKTVSSPASTGNTPELKPSNTLGPN
ncbi:MAG: lipopolysaccharide transport periplasmic protein LptA [Burkholderiales bacterium]